MNDLIEAIQEICAKKNIGHDDMSLIENDLNDYINRLVKAAYDQETQKQAKRELVDTHVKIKGVEGARHFGDAPDQM